MRLGVRLRGLFMGLMLLAVAGPVMAVQPDEVLKDPAMEARARALGRDLRCMVCQNQSIDDSDADLARDLRVLLRQRLVAGDSDEQAKQYLVDRYGDYVLLRPPFKTTTLVLWLGPAALLLAGGWGAVMFFRRRTASAGPAGERPLDETEQRRLKRLLSNDREG
ncbi:MAG: cytochrome c-type biogenesis protein CcmH [Telmatospirillum sp.]|nr:cytochrome c-type biogenesis protein CcmH [Telmatospirillum sp.]